MSFPRAPPAAESLNLRPQLSKRLHAGGEMKHGQPPLAHIVTLGVRDFEAQREFYRRLDGCRCDDDVRTILC
jgi:hypothetical protein